MINTAIFIPRTPEGDLCKIIRTAEIELGKILSTKVKVVEETGKYLRDIFHKPDPWAGMGCDREKCLICSQIETDNNPGNCRKHSVEYTTTCIPCQKNGVITQYKGESGKFDYQSRGRMSPICGNM